MNLFKILLIDDEVAITESLSYALEKAQFNCTSAQSLQEAELFFHQESFHLVILDLTLGDGHGFDWLRKIRQHSQVPVLILSSHDDEVEHIVGLELGADDYINKPFSPREVVARVRAVLRRSNQYQGLVQNLQSIQNPSELKAAKPAAILNPLDLASSIQTPINISIESQEALSLTMNEMNENIAQLENTPIDTEAPAKDKSIKQEYLSFPLVMNKEMYMAWVYGGELILSHLEFELLYFLYQRPHFVFSRYALLDRVWGDDVVISERTVDVHIKTIRKKLLLAGLNIEAIETIRGVGYKYILNHSQL